MGEEDTMATTMAEATTAATTTATIITSTRVEDAAAKVVAVAVDGGDAGLSRRQSRAGEATLMQVHHYLEETRKRPAVYRQSQIR